MLAAAGVPFEVVPTSTNEAAEKTRLQGRSASELALGLAEAKARGAEGALVLGADQTLELDDGSMLDKVTSREEAAEHLALLSGLAHRLHAAAVIIQAGEVVWSHVGTATLHVRPLSPSFIQSYLDAEFEHVRWSVGCYHLEGRGAQLFERIEGSHFDVLGLPLLPLLGYLRNRGIMAS